MYGCLCVGWITVHAHRNTGGIHHGKKKRSGAAVADGKVRRPGWGYLDVIQSTQNYLHGVNTSMNHLVP